MSSNPFSLSGLASGLDTKSLINQLISLEQQPLLRLQRRRSTIADTNTAFQAINTKLQALQSAATDLTLDANIKAKSATTTNASVVTGTASAGAALGSYRIRVDRLATASSVTTNSAAGSPISDPTLALTSLNTSSPITNGNFTIQYTAGGTLNNATVTVTSGMVLNDVFNAISTATGGNVTAALGAGADANKVVLTGAGGTTSMVVGSSSDTSNFASVMNLRGATFDPVALTSKSTNGIGVTNINVGMGSANASALSTPITTSGAGSFAINGVTINYDTGTDSIKNVLDRINQSSAGVVASYNSVNDRFTITSRTTGSGAITMSDTTGNFLQAIGVADPARQVVTNGQNALIGIEGINGFSSATLATDFTADVSSATNDFSNVISGLTVSAKSVSTGNTRETLTVGTDTTAIGTKVKAFVDQYNQAIDAIEAARSKGGSNPFDTDLSMVEQRMQGMASSIVGSLATSPKSLMDIGISSSRTDRLHLQIDQTRFNAALSANPDAVAAVFQNGTDGIAQQFKTYMTNIGGTNGVFATRASSTQMQLRGVDNQINMMQRRIDMDRTRMVNQFTAMEKAVARLHSQQNAFLSQLGSLR